MKPDIFPSLSSLLSLLPLALIYGFISNTCQQRKRREAQVVVWFIGESFLPRREKEHECVCVYVGGSGFLCVNSSTLQVDSRQSDRRVSLMGA